MEKISKHKRILELTELGKQLVSEIQMWKSWRHSCSWSQYIYELGMNLCMLPITKVFQRDFVKFSLWSLGNMTSNSLLSCLFINIPTNGLKGKPFSAPHDVTTPNSNGEVLPVNLHNQLLIILSNSNKKYLVSHHVGNCYLNSWFLSWSRQQSEVFQLVHTNTKTCLSFQLAGIGGYGQHLNPISQ